MKISREDSALRWNNEKSGFFIFRGTGIKIRSLVSGIMSGKYWNANIVFWTVLLLVLVGSLFLRILGTKQGLPYLHYWDEPQTVATSLTMLKTGDFNPHFFNYGTLLIYLSYIVDVLHYLSLMGKPETAEAFIRNLNELQVSSFMGTGWRWGISHPSFYHWNRILIAVLGAGTVVSCYFIGRTLANKWIGLAAATFLGVLKFHIDQSAVVTPNTPAAFFFTMTIMFSLLYLEKENRSYLTLSLVFCGLAAATKYNAALAILAVPLALIILQVKKSVAARGQDWLWILLIPAATFFLAMPYALLDSVTFLQHLGFEVRHYKVMGHGAASIQPGFDHLWFQLTRISGNIGVVASVVCLIGILFFLRRTSAIIVFLPVVVYLAYMSGTKVNFHRNFVLVYPFVAVLFGLGLCMLHRICLFAADWLPTSLSLARLPITLLPTVAALAILIPNATSAVRVSSVKMSQTETRTKGVTEANHLLKQDAYTKIIVAEELRVHLQDLRKIKGKYLVATLDSIRDCKMPVANSLLIVPMRIEAYYAKNKGKRTFKSHAWLLNKLKHAPRRKKIGRNATMLDLYSRDPGIMLAGYKKAAFCPA
jgi:hypothetical protein